MHITVRAISHADALCIASTCADRVARYKLRHVWMESFETFPLPGQHTGRVCIDSATNALFTQIPYHFHETEGEKYVAVVEKGLAVWRAEADLRFALIFCSQSLLGRVPFLNDFAAACLRAAGSWKQPSGIEPREFYCEASAFTL